MFVHYTRSLFCHHEFIKIRENYMQKAQSVSICASIVDGS